MVSGSFGLEDKLGEIIDGSGGRGYSLGGAGELFGLSNCVPSNEIFGTPSRRHQFGIQLLIGWKSIWPIGRGYISLKGARLL